MKDWKTVIEFYTLLSHKKQFIDMAHRMLALVDHIRQMDEFETVIPMTSHAGLELGLPTIELNRVGVSWMPFDLYNVYILNLEDHSLNNVLVVNQDEVVPKLVEYLGKVQAGREKVGLP